MNEKKGKCCSCRSFHAYYTKGYCCLLREKNGLCMRHNKITAKSESCEEWHCRKSLSKAERKSIAVNSIPEIYNKIALIEQIIKEE